MSLARNTSTTGRLSRLLNPGDRELAFHPAASKLTLSATSALAGQQCPAPGGDYHAWRRPGAAKRRTQNLCLGSGFRGPVLRAAPELTAGPGSPTHRCLTIRAPPSYRSFDVRLSIGFYSAQKPKQIPPLGMC